ncbi:DODA-type extradiol aromatic ring-opening family dioxygenase [Paenibacillus thermotolerans]|uniref:DODA-type extradiol aromatic ring-opening family dioxygenase n=1 Tax=Paenibacillus thermotolerans TaxID=3027807 RepID=UPI002367E0EF|nr:MULTISPECIES: class III extradiol ring-cleavage dioxygenase [unclassified Paenibacillus]
MVPSLFLAHGSPMIAIETTAYTTYLAELGKTLAPKAIVIFTAHWESETVTISSTDDTYETIYDFGGFPPEMYRLTYPAKGSAEVASKVERLLAEHGIPSRLNASRGLDHGSWTLLLRLFPKADIPVVQVSVNPYLPMERQFEIGQALNSLGAENILVIGSGATVHNLRMLSMKPEVEPWAVAFDDWLIEHMQMRDYEALAQVMERAPSAKLAVPRPEHFVPLYIAMGAGSPDGEVKLLHRSYELGSLSYLAVQF